MIKRFLIAFYILFGLLSFAQVQFLPLHNHETSPYTATITGNGTLYYTLDGTEPTFSSPSAENQIQFTVSTNLTAKVRIKNGGGQLSEVFQRPYWVGEIPLVKTFSASHPSGPLPARTCITCSPKLWQTFLAPEMRCSLLARDGKRLIIISTRQT